MIAARTQAKRYAYALPAKEGHPPFIIVADIGHTIQVYADFNDTGFYAPYPSARENTILLEDLRKPEIRERLRKIWTDPLSLNSSRENEKVTYQLVLTLSDLAQSLENEGHDPDVVALFIMRPSSHYLLRIVAYYLLILTHNYWLDLKRLQNNLHQLLQTYGKL